MTPFTPKFPSRDPDWIPMASFVMDPTPPKQRFRRFSRQLVRELDAPARERHPEET